MPFIKPRDSRHCKDQSVSDCEHVDEYYSGFCSSTVILEILNGHIKSILAAKKTNDTDGGSVRCMVLFRLLFRCRRAFSPLERPFDRRNVARRSLSHIVSVLQVIRETPNDVERLLIAGHEPTWSETVSGFIGGGAIRFPTAALAAVQFDVWSWQAVDWDCGLLLWLVNPRLLKATANKPRGVPGRG